MFVEVAFLAKDLGPRAEGKTVVVVDVLRATSTLATMFERGASRVMLAETIEEARDLKKECEVPCLLVGETGSLPPPDFDYGNSPVEMKDLDFGGKAIAFSSSNGAKAVARVSRAASVFLGSFANASAVVEKALDDALEHGRDVAFVASGQAFGTEYGIDDCVCCGFLADRFLQRLAERTGVARDPLDYPPDRDPHQFTGDCELDDSVFIALRLHRSYGGDILRAFREGRHGQSLLRLGFGRDLVYCSQVDTSRAVPRLVVQPDGKMVLEPSSSLS